MNLSKRIFKFQCFGISKISRERIIVNKMIKAKQNQEKKLNEQMNSSSVVVKKTIFDPIEALDMIRDKIKDDKDFDKKMLNGVVLSLNLNVKENVNIRGVRESPGGIVKHPKICVFTSEMLREKAKAAGATILADDQFIQNLINGTEKIKFNLAICSTDYQPKMKLLGRLLGPKGLMPSPKIGTIVEPTELESTVQRFYNGTKEFKGNKKSPVCVNLGRLNFSNESISKNIDAFIKSLESRVPDGSTLRGIIKSAKITISTLGPAINISIPSLLPNDPTYFYKREKIEKI